MIWHNFIITVLVILFSTCNVVSAAEDDLFEIETEGAYPMVIGSSNYFAKEMALFIAKKKAVDLAGKYLSRNNLIGVFDQERDEISRLGQRI